MAQQLLFYISLKRHLQGNDCTHYTISNTKHTSNNDNRFEVYQTYLIIPNSSKWKIIDRAKSNELGNIRY